MKLRLGWNDEMRNVIEQAQAAVDGGADALFVHGRTTQCALSIRRRLGRDWQRRRGRLGARRRQRRHPVSAGRRECAGALGRAGVMSARGVLIKPWLFREVNDGYRDLSADERVAIYRRYVTLAREHWGADAHGLERVRQFTRWHIDFWHRYRPRHDDGTFPQLQIREVETIHVTPLDAFLARTDDAAHEYLADCLTFEREIDLGGGAGTGIRTRAGVRRGRGLGATAFALSLNCSSSSSDFGQSSFSRRDNPRSASSLPSVWQVGQ